MRNNDADQNLKGSEALKQIAEIGKNARTCLFSVNLGKEAHVTPLAIQGIEDDGNFYFLSGKNSERNKFVQKDNVTQITIQNDGKSEYLNLFGKTTISEDQELKEKYWSKFAEAWFDGVEDPEVTVLKFEPENGDYWTAENGKMLTFAKMVYAAATKTEVDDGSVKGELKVD